LLRIRKIWRERYREHDKRGKAMSHDVRSRIDVAPTACASARLLHRSTHGTQKWRKLISVARSG
jgi:hypothetical protein